MVVGTGGGLAAATRPLLAGPRLRATAGQAGSAPSPASNKASTGRRETWQRARGATRCRPTASRPAPSKKPSPTWMCVRAPLPERLFHPGRGGSPTSGTDSPARRGATVASLASRAASTCRWAANMPDPRSHRPARTSSPSVCLAPTYRRSTATASSRTSSPRTSPPSSPRSYSPSTHRITSKTRRSPSSSAA